MTVHFVVAALVFSAGLFTCRLALSAALRLSIIDHPNWRSSHTRPTPRGGGMGILLAAFPGIAVAAMAATPAAAPPPLDMLALLGGAGALAALGFADDRRPLGPVFKFAVQGAVAAGLVVAAGPVVRVALPGADVPLGPAAGALSVVWLVGAANAYNFMDGIDGIAGLFAAIAGGFLAALGFIGGEGAGAWIALPVAAAAASFLTVNWSPARVFMGDVGSLPTGFLLGAAALAASRDGGVPFPAAVLAVWPFLWDVSVTFARRLVRRENVLAAHRSHLYQRLTATGFSHRQVALLYGGWTVLSGGLAILYLLGDRDVQAGALGAAGLTGMIVIFWTWRRESRRGSDGA